MVMGYGCAVGLRIVQQSNDVKSESQVGKNQLRRGAAKSRPTYVLLAGNDTVPILMWRGGCVCTLPMVPSRSMMFDVRRNASPYRDMRACYISFRKLRPTASTNNADRQPAVLMMIHGCVCIGFCAAVAALVSVVGDNGGASTRPMVCHFTTTITAAVLLRYCFGRPV